MCPERYFVSSEQKSKKEFISPIDIFEEEAYLKEISEADQKEEKYSQRTSSSTPREKRKYSSQEHFVLTLTFFS